MALQVYIICIIIVLAGNGKFYITLKKPKNKKSNMKVPHEHSCMFKWVSLAYLPWMKYQWSGKLIFARP